MGKKFSFLFTLFTLSSLTLSARELMCEYCESQEYGPCRPLFVERSQIFLHTEFLYWTVEEGALDYAAKMDKNNPSTHAMALGNYHTADFDWDPGFRVALSYYRCNRFWELTGQYTWFQADGSDSVFKPEETDRFLNPTRHTTIYGPFEKAKSHINFHYQLGDLYVSRIWDPNPHLRLRTLVGITGTHICQRLKIDYTNLMREVETVHEKWKFSGGGLRVGATFDWFWGVQFYITGRATFAILAGSYENTELQEQIQEEIITADAKYDKGRLVTHGQFMLGPSWQVPCDCWSFELFAGWEFNVWGNLHERIRTNFTFVEESKETRYAENLVGIQGFTLRLTLGY